MNKHLLRATPSGKFPSWFRQLTKVLFAQLKMTTREDENVSYLNNFF